MYVQVEHPYKSVWGMTRPAKQLAAVESGIYMIITNGLFRGTGNGMIDANNLLFFVDC